MKCVVMRPVKLLAATAFAVAIAAGPCLALYPPYLRVPTALAGAGGGRAKTGPSVVQVREPVSKVLLATAVMAEGQKETERGRFELPLPFRADRFSKPAHSTTLPPLQRAF